MSTFELVDEFTHIISENGFGLSSSCSMQLSHLSGHDSLDKASSSKLDSVSINKSWWVGRGDGLRLYLSIVTDGLVDNRIERQKLLEGLGTIIQDSQIWSQLFFNVSLTLPAHDSLYRPHDADIVLLLSCSHDSSPKENLRRSRHAFTVSDARPPEGVVSRKVEGIKLTLRFSRTVPNLYKKRKGDVRTEPGDFCDIYDILFSSDDALCVSPFPSSVQQTSSSLFKLSQSSSSSHASSQSTSIEMEMLEEEHELDRENNFKDLQVYSTSAILTQSNHHHLSTRKRSGSGEDSNSPILDLEASAKLIDAALRTMICDNRTTLLPGVELKEKSSEPKLAEVLPALFSPGYLQAISQRNHFIPRIAHSISSVARKSKSPFLLSKLDALMDRSTVDDHIHNQEHRIANESHVTSRTKRHRHVNVLQVHLWNTIQSQLYDPLAARQLKPLQVDTIGMSITTTSSNEMLDERSSLSSPLDQPCSLTNEPKYPEWNDLLFNDNAEDDIQDDSDNLFEDLDLDLFSCYDSEMNDEILMFDEICPGGGLFDDRIHNSSCTSYSLSHRPHYNSVDLDIILNSDNMLLDIQEP